MIVNATRITLNPDKRTEFFQTIGRLLENVNPPKGCRTFHIYIEWETESDLNRYLSSNDFAILRGAITVLSIRSVDCKALSI